VIRVSQWAEIRQMHMVQQIPKKQIARRLGVDVKTVRRALDSSEAPIRRVSPRRGRRLDKYREQIVGWLEQEPKLTAKRIRRLLVPKAGAVPGRTVREYVAEVKGELFPREAYVHRSGRAAESLEADFGESWALIGGKVRKVKFFVATLPYSNVYFAKAYPVERLECLMDGLNEAFAYFGGVPERVVLDNTSLAVKKVLAGRDREVTEGFDGFRGEYPFAAEFCAPAKGWEKGSVETGVKYVRNNVFRPMPKVESFEALNELIVRELEADLDGRTVADGRPVQEAWAQEREHLRPMPLHPPEACLTVSRVVDKFGNVRQDGVHYSVPIEHAYRAAWVKLSHDRVRIVVRDRVVAEHGRSFKVGDKVINPLHVLPLLERKSRAVSEATAIRQWALPETIKQLRFELRGHTRNPDREWVQVLQLLEDVTEQELETAVEEAIERGSPRLETIRLLLRHAQQGPRTSVEPVELKRQDLATLQVAQPSLAAYDVLWSGS
jgi:transposase